MKLPHSLLGLLICFVIPSVTLAYPVAPALTLDKLVKEADLVCKAEVVASKSVEDPWFDKVHGFHPQDTTLKIIAIYEGKEERKEIHFRHYTLSDKGGVGPYEPQHYELQVGRTYVLFAKRADGEGEYRQLWKNHRSLEDQGVVLAADGRPWAGVTIEEVLWNELTGLLKHEKPEDVRYGLSHLDALSGGDYRRLADFDRVRVLAAVVPLMKHAKDDIAIHAIGVLGSHNPYMSEDYAPGWLATVGQGHIPGFGTWDTKYRNFGGEGYWKQLVAVVESEAALDRRVQAARALGRSKVDEVLPLAEKWTKDTEPRIRRVGAVLMADYHERANTKLLQALVKDEQAIARRGAAEAIGFGQFTHMTDELSTLLDDTDSQVAGAAALSLLSFPLADSRETMKKHLNHPQHQALFVNALAHGDPEPYLDQLCNVIRKNQQPENWWGGFVVWGDSWQILFQYVQKQPREQLHAGKFDKLLTALEIPGGGEEAIKDKSPKYYSSSEPRDLYALYVQRGLDKRAAKFRAACKQSVTYDIDYYFDMVDKNPKQYQGQ